jgi:hypothetical protein
LPTATFACKCVLTMPPKRAVDSRTNAKAVERVATTEKSYWDLYFDKLLEVKKRCNMEGYVVVNGVDSDEEDDEEEDDEEKAVEGVEPANKKRKVVSDEEKLKDLRIVFINKSRNDALKKARRFVSCGQVGALRMFDTNTGNMIIDDIPKKVSAAMKSKTSAAKFDALLALTYELSDNDYWMCDNEEWEVGAGCSKALKGLAAAWKTLLALPDAELGK